MKKINVKKLNQFYSNLNTTEEMKSLIERAVDDFVFAEVKNPICVQILTDLGLLSE